MSDIILTTGEKLLELRKKAKLTSEKLCHEIENKFGYIITKSKYNEIENDKDKDFGYQAFLYLAKYYNVSVDWLLGLAGAPTTDKNKKTAIKVTGLSLKAIDNLQYLSKHNVVFFDNENGAYYLPNDKLQLRIQAINKLIEAELFAQLIDNLVYLDRTTSDIQPCKADNHEQCKINHNLSNAANICRYNVYRVNEKICDLFDRRESNG